MLIRLIVAPLLGTVLAAGSSVGLVYSQTNAPSTNPSDTPILTYGTPAT